MTDSIADLIDEFREAVRENNNVTIPRQMVCDAALDLLLDVDFPGKGLEKVKARRLEHWLYDQAIYEYGLSGRETRNDIRITGELPCADKGFRRRGKRS